MYDIPNVTRITNARGQQGWPGMAEPKPGSVVLIHGAHGTAWQRQSDGLWHRAGGRHPDRGRDWSWVLRQRNVVLVYDAPVRDPEPVLHAHIHHVSDVCSTACPGWGQ